MNAQQAFQRAVAVSQKYTEETVIGLGALKGEKGEKGDPGEKGDAGASAVSASIDGDRHLIIIKDDGTSIDCGVLPESAYDDTNIKQQLNALIAAIGDISMLGLTVQDLVTAINLLATGSIKSVGFSNKALNIEYIDGTTESIDCSALITESSLGDLKDVGLSNLSDKDVLSYDIMINKFVNKKVATTDELVKMNNSATTGAYLEDLVDGTTIENVDGKLVAKLLDGQIVTIAEINTLKGMDINIKDTLNSIATGGMRFKDVVQTYAQLSTTPAVNGDVYIVNADETNGGKRVAYIYAEAHNGFVIVGESGLSVRNFTTEPIDLTTEVTGVLPQANMDMTDIITQANVEGTYSETDINPSKIPNLAYLYGVQQRTAQEFGKKVNIVDIVDNLLSSDATVPLSANQGRKLEEKKLDKANIATALSDTVTNKQVVGAKDFYNHASTRNIRTYTDVSQLGLGIPISVEEIFNALPVNSILIQQCNSNTDHITNLPEGYGILTITKVENDILKFSIEFKTSSRDSVNVNHLYLGQLKGGDGTGLTWERVCTTSVPDVPKTNIDLGEDCAEVYKKLSTEPDADNTWFFVKNGWCMVQIDILCIKEGQGFKRLATSLPKPMSAISNEIGGTGVAVIEGEKPLQVTVNDIGGIVISSGRISPRYIGTFSYPVAEDWRP